MSDNIVDLFTKAPLTNADIEEKEIVDYIEKLNAALIYIKMSHALLSELGRTNKETHGMLRAIEEEYPYLRFVTLEKLKEIADKYELDIPQL